MIKETNKAAPKWEEFLEQDDARIRKEREQEQGIFVGLQAAEKQTAGSETEQPPEDKYEAMYEDFRMLPEDLQEQIIQEIASKRNQGSDPQDLVFRAINLTRAYRQFMEVDTKGDHKPPEREKWRQELDNILNRFRKIKSEKKEKPPEPPASGRIN